MNRSRGRSPISVRLLARLARRTLPKSITTEFDGELDDTLHDRYRALAPGALRGARLWAGELGGLLATSWRGGPTPTNVSITTRGKPDMLDSLRRDIRYAFRMTTKTPALSAIAIVSLALGIAANSMIYGLAHSWLLRPLPYPDADRLTLVYEIEPAINDRVRSVTPANFFDWREESGAFESMIASTFRVAILTGTDRPEQVTVAEVSPEFFDILGSRASQGRTFASDEGSAGADPVVVMKETLWRNRYGADPAMIGDTITLDGTAHTVVGVVPETFDFLLGNVGLWIANDFEEQRDERSARSLVIAGVLREGVSADQAQVEMSAIAARIEERFPEENRGVGADVVPIRENFPGQADTLLVQLLMGVVMLVLLVACVNVANLYLAKAETRQRELSIRNALGAGRSALFRQLITESVMLALIAGAFGMLGGYWALRWLNQAALPDEIPSFFDPQFDGAVVLFTVAIAALSGLAFGISPALQGLRGRLAGALADGSRGGTSNRSSKRMRSVLVATQFAMALAVLIGAGVLFDLLHTRLDVDPGFNPDGLITAQLSLPTYKYADAEARSKFYDDLRRELEELPGQSAWAFASSLPRTNSWSSTPFSIDSRPVEDDQRPTAMPISVSNGYFDGLGIPLREGRAFGPDDLSDRPSVVIVNERFVARHFEGEDPLGARITMFDDSREIVGVARDIVQTRMSGLEPIPSTVFFPVAQRPAAAMSIAVRADGDPHTLAGPLQSAVWRVDPDQPITEVRTIDEHFALVLAGPRTVAKIVFAIGLLTLALASIGVYGVMAFTVNQQAREIGIRMALGAQAGRVLRQVGGQGIVLSGAGLVLGIPLAVLVVQTIRAALASPEFSGENGIGIAPIAMVTMLLVGVALLASYLPARRATKIDPIRALQEE